MKQLYSRIKKLTPRKAKCAAVTFLKFVGFDYKARAKVRKLREIENFLVSFPKSGRTWLRFLIGNYYIDLYRLTGLDPVLPDLFHLSDERVPSIHITHDENKHRLPPDKIYFDDAFYSSKKVIFLVRHPFDVIVSLYFHHSKRTEEYSGTISEFIRRDQGGFLSLLKFYEVWIDGINRCKSHLLLRYEDLLEDTEKQLEQVIRFIDSPDVEPEIIRKSVKKSSFDEMRKIEESGASRSSILRPGKAANESSYKVRSGKVGEYLKFLSKEDIDWMSKKIDVERMSKIGYFKEGLDSTEREVGLKPRLGSSI